MSKINYDSLSITAKMCEKIIQDQNEDDVIKELRVDHYRFTEGVIGPIITSNIAIVRYSWFNEKDLNEIKENVFKMINQDFEYGREIYEFLLNNESYLHVVETMDRNNLSYKQLLITMISIFSVELIKKLPEDYNINIGLFALIIIHAFLEKQGFLITYEEKLTFDFIQSYKHENIHDLHGILPVIFDRLIRSKYDLF